jgi:hypothetical protein
MAVEKNDSFFFFVISSHRKHVRSGPDLQYTLCPTANMLLNCWGKNFLFLLTVPVM